MALESVEVDSLRAELEKEAKNYGSSMAVWRLAIVNGYVRDPFYFRDMGMTWALSGHQAVGESGGDGCRWWRGPVHAGFALLGPERSGQERGAVRHNSRAPAGPCGGIDRDGAIVDHAG